MRAVVLESVGQPTSRVYFDLSDDTLPAAGRREVSHVSFISLADWTRLWGNVALGSRTLFKKAHANSIFFYALAAYFESLPSVSVSL